MPSKTDRDPATPVADASNPAIGVLEYGEIPYGQALAQQYALRDGLAPEKFTPSDSEPVSPPDVPGTSDIAGYLMVVEHPPVVTLGKRSDTSHLINRQKLAEHGVQVFEIDRGGEATFHAPGQLVLYPVLRLRDYGLGVVDVVRGLAAAISDFCAELGVSAGYDADDPGVWTSEESEVPGRRKLASVGMRVQRGVSTHGAALNLINDTEPFSWIRACGREDAPMTSLASLVDDQHRREDLLKPISVARSLYPAIGELTGADLVDVRVALPDREEWVEETPVESLTQT